jgi:hypothetical protein
MEAAMADPLEIDNNPLLLFVHMMGFADPYGFGFPPPPPNVEFDVTPVTDVVPIAGDSHGEPDDAGMMSGDGHYHPDSSEPGPPPPPDPPAQPASGGDDVVPIAGDSSAPGSGDSIYQNIGDIVAPQPPPGSDGMYQAVDDVVDGIVDLDAPPSLYGPPPEVVGGLVAWVKSAPKWLIPALLAIVVAVIVAVVALGGSSKSTAPSTTASTQAATTPTTASTPAATTAPTTTEATTPTPPAASLVTLSLGLGQVSGSSLPLPVTVTAAPNAPGVEKVTLALTGPGVPGSYAMTVAPGKSVSHTFVGTGCASWTVRVASVNGTVIHAAGDPNLENGATHKC